jgi:hypothetical protein
MVSHLGEHGFATAMPEIEAGDTHDPSFQLFDSGELADDILPSRSRDVFFGRRPILNGTGLDASGPSPSEDELNVAAEEGGHFEVSARQSRRLYFGARRLPKFRLK